MPDLGQIFDIWPVWAVIILFVILNLDKILKNLAVFLPFLVVPLERRAELDLVRVNAEAQEQYNDAEFARRMLGVIETSLERQADVATRNLEVISELKESVTQLRHAIDRNSGLITGLNQAVSKFADITANLAAKIDSLKWLIVNKINGKPGDQISIMASLEEEEKLSRRRGAE